jgi:ABC-type polysaccharide/polyol phosphate export permease
LTAPTTSLFSSIAASRELTWNLTLRELRSKYKRSVLGWSWSLLNPLATVAIYSLVFRLFIRIEVPPGEPSGLNVFGLWMLCGLLPWNFFAAGLTTSMGTIVGNSGLITKVFFPRHALVVASVASLVVSFSIELGVLLTILLLFGNMVLPWLPMIVVLVAIQAAFVLGIGLALSVLTVYFRDLQHLIGTVLLQAWFFATPVVYPISLVPDTATVWGMSIPVGTIYRLNPMTQFVMAYRDVMYDLRWPPLNAMLYMIGVALASLFVGWRVFRRFEGRLAEEL